MKIWFDILTPKQLLFFEPMIKRLRKNHHVICTSRNYREVNQIAKIRKFKLVFVGKHGGGKKHDKLNASIDRMVPLSKIIKRFSPDITVSFCSPEAARVSYGLGIKHIAFSDSPHANAVMRLSLPFVQKLLIPWVIPKKKFTKFGINSKDIIQYRAIDAATIAKRSVANKTKLPFNSKQKKTILIRVEEAQAAYSSKSSKIVSIIKAVLKEFKNENIVILGRYSPQIKFLNQTFRKKIKILSKAVDGKILLMNTDVFVGSGGTMTAESALLGVPTISYNAVPNFIESYLVQKKLVKRETNPKLIARSVKKFIETPNVKNKQRAKKELRTMEDPYTKLVKVIQSI